MLTVESLTKSFDPPTGLIRLLVRTASSKRVDALRGIDFSVDAGQIVGLVGPNGAGKSTLIKICASLITPTSGRVLVDGIDTTEDPEHVRRVLGLLLADERALYWRLSGRENLRFFGMMAGLSRAEAWRRADELLEQFDLARRDGRVFGYSSGMRVRLGLARALVARPRLLMLDEPSRSLDPVATAEFHGSLRDVAADGTAVLLSSHRLDEVVSVCDRVLAVVGGEQRAWAPTAELFSGGTAANDAAIRALFADQSNGESS
jgi:ABC-2 type transport system ATP-binding protein